jgi:hypothetical protein
MKYVETEVTAKLATIAYLSTNTKKKNIRKYQQN